MAWSERVLSGRPSRHAGDPWTGAAGSRRPAAAVHGLAVEPLDPFADEGVRARIADAVRAAEEQGYAAGRAAGEQELATAVQAAMALAHKLETAVPKDVDMLARTVAELSVLVARRIVGAELRHDPSVLVAAIEAGLRQAAGASVVHVELHPMVVDTVEAVWAARHGTRHRGFSWSFTGDPTLTPDGCRLRTEHGLVDAGFEDQLSQIAAALDAAIPGYLGSALGPAAEASESAERAALLGTGMPPRIVSPADPAAIDPATRAAPDAEGLPPGDASGLPADLDLDALATLGLDGLEPDALAAPGDDPTTGPAA